jgi:hypothetical protein
MIGQPAHGKQVGTGKQPLAILGGQPMARLELVGNLEKTGLSEAGTRKHRVPEIVDLL